MHNMDWLERAGAEHQGSALLSPSKEQLHTDTVWLVGKIDNGERKIHACFYICFFQHIVSSQCIFHLSGRLTALHALPIVSCPCRCTALYILTCLFWNLAVSSLEETDVFLLPLRSLNAPLLPHQHLLPISSRRALTVTASWYSFSSTPVAWLFSWGQEVASYSRLVVDHCVRKAWRKLCCLCLLLICVLMPGLMCKVSVQSSRKYALPVLCKV